MPRSWGLFIHPTRSRGLLSSHVSPIHASSTARQKESCPEAYKLRHKGIYEKQGQSSVLRSDASLLVEEPKITIGRRMVEGISIVKPTRSTISQIYFILEQHSTFWRLQVRASSYNSNKLTNQMQQFYKFITWRFVSLNMFRAPPRPSSGAYNCINSLWFYLGAWW